jgi:hypothetical protein
MTTQQAVQEDTSMTDAGVVAVSGEWVPRVGLIESLPPDRAGLIRGLFELAAWVADNPEAPVPSVTASVYTGRDGWESRCRVVDQVAAALGLMAGPRPGRAGTRYEVETTFGPIRLYSTAITDDEFAAYNAADSYLGAVSPAATLPTAASGGGGR